MLFNLIKWRNRFSWEINKLLSNVFNSVKETDRLRKEINRLLSSIYLTVNNSLRRSQNFDFLGLTNLTPGQFWRASTHTDIES